MGDARGYRRTTYSGVYWRGDVLYAVVRLAAVDARGRRRKRWVRVGTKKQGATPRDAATTQRELQRREDRLFRGEDDPRALAAAAGEQRPIAELIERYAERLEARRRSSKHVRETRGYLESWAAGCGVACLRDADPGRLTAWLGEGRDAGWSARTANAYRAAVLAFCRWAADHGLTLRNPIPAGMIAKANEEADQVRPQRAMTLSEAQRLIAAAPPRRAAMYALGVYAGVRWSEMARLRWANLDLDGPHGPTLIIDASQSKNGRTAELPLVEPAADALRRWRAWKGRSPGRRIEGVGARDADLVFGAVPSHRDWKNDLRRAGLIGAPDPADPQGPNVGDAGYVNARGERLERKCLRTTLGTALAERGVSIQVAQRLMRHSDPKLTMKHYTRIGLNPMRAGAERLLEAPEGDGDRQGATARQPREASRGVAGVDAVGRKGPRMVS